MRRILLLGAGKSSAMLINYLVEKSSSEDWHLTVADLTREHALQKTRNRANTTATSFDFYNAVGRKQLISDSDIVISMLPAAMHIPVAENCLELKKNLVTPSYISDAMKALHEKVKKKNLIFMNEIGLDPGIDHMSSMQIIDKLKSAGSEITGFKSHCGGLIAPANDEGPWHYKFTWNPRNVILAGQGEGDIQYLENGKKQKLKYEELFTSTSEVKLKGYGKFESYPNRDSLKYLPEYGLKGVKTMYRGTLRRPPFCKGWNVLVQLGLTNRKERLTDKLKEEIMNLTKSGKFMADRQVKQMLHSAAVIPMLFLHKEKWIVPSEFLEQVLEHTWTMQPAEKDMVVMIHEIEFKSGRKKKSMQSSMIQIGQDAEQTAMATTVGLPVGMVTKMILNGAIKRKGVLMPKYPEIYNPILAELKEYGISFKEQIV